MTLFQLRSVIAGYLQKSVLELTVNGVDLSLMALNQVRRDAEMLHDFEFSRRHVTVTIDAVGGGTLEDPVLEGQPSCEVKSVIECGIYDDDFNVMPVEWTTIAESLERQRQIKPGFGPRYPADWEATTGYYDVGLTRIALCGNDIWLVPQGEQHKLIDLEFEVYAFTPDWSDKTDSVRVVGVLGMDNVDGTYWPYGTFNGRPFYLNIANGGVAPGGATPAQRAIWYRPGQWMISAAQWMGQTPATGNYQSMAATTMYPAGGYSPHGAWQGNGIVEVQVGNDVTDIWLRHGAQYLLWAAIVQINHMCKEFVFRQEGNLPPPEKLAESALENFRQWDSFRYEENRRHVY
jgi:hypothetical protein